MAEVAQTFALNPYAAEQARIQRLQKYADILQSQAVQPDEKFSYAGIEAPTSAAGGLAKALKMGVSGYLQGSGMRESEDLANKMTTERKASMDQVVAALQGTPATPEGGGMGVDADQGKFAKPAVPGSLDAAHAIMLSSNLPDLQAAGLSGMAAQAKTAGDRAFTLNRDSLQNNFSAAQGGLARAHSDYMADKSQENQEKLQKAQQAFTAAQQAAQQVFTAGENNLNRANAIDAVDRKTRADAPGRLTEAAGKLRDDFNNQETVKNHKAVVPIYKSMLDAVKRDTAVADMNLVYGMAKILDPPSVVRESETSMVVKAGSPAERFIGMFNYVAGGGRLTTQQRKNLIDEAGSRFQAHQSSYGETVEQFKGIAKRGNLNVEDVITGLPMFTPDGKNPPPVGNPGGPPGRTPEEEDEYKELLALQAAGG